MKQALETAGTVLSLHENLRLSNFQAHLLVHEANSIGWVCLSESAYL
jgi:hypothetical protein